MMTMSYLSRQNLKLSILLSILVHGAIFFWPMKTDNNQWPVAHDSYKPIAIVIRARLAGGSTKVSDKPSIASSDSIINSRSDNQSRTVVVENTTAQRPDLSLTAFSTKQYRVGSRPEVTPVKPLIAVSADIISQSQEGKTSSKDATDASDAQRLKENYLTNLRAEINQRKYYPRLARRLGKQGEVWVEFMIHRNGQITDISIRESSGVAILDRAARKSLEKLNTYKPFPQHMRASELTVAVKMHYSVYR